MAVTDPLPAGFEPVESWFATTAAAPRARQQDQRRRRRRLVRLVAARRLRSRRAPRRSRPALRDAPQRRPSHVHLRRPRHDRGHVPHGAGARGGDVRAGGVRAHGDGGDRDRRSRATGAARRWRSASGSCRYSDRTALTFAALRCAAARSVAAAVAGCRRCWIRCGPIPAGCSTASTRRRRWSSIGTGGVLYEALSRRRIAGAAARRGEPAAGARGGDDRGRGSPLLRASRRRSGVARCARRGTTSSRATIVEGGSTITQQVAKLLIQRREGVQHARRARRRSARWCWRCGSSTASTSAQILALYLNLAAYGNQTAGAGRASQSYFGVDAVDADAGAGGVPGRPAAAADALQPVSQSIAVGAAAAADRAAAHGGGRRADAPSGCAKRAPSRLALTAERAARSARRTSSRWCWPSAGRHARRPRIVTTLDAELQREVAGHHRARTASRCDAHGAANVAVVVLDNATRRVAGVGGLGRLRRRRAWRRDQRPARRRGSRDRR